MLTKTLHYNISFSTSTRGIYYIFVVDIATHSYNLDYQDTTLLY